MKTTLSKTLMLAGLLALAPAGAAFAAQDCSGDAQGAYHRAMPGDDPGYQCVPAGWQPSGAAGPAGPIIAADQTCGRDPFQGTRTAFNTGGPAHLCGLMVSDQTGAQGPGGPIMGGQWKDPFLAYERSFAGD